MFYWGNHCAQAPGVFWLYSFASFLLWHFIFCCEPSVRKALIMPFNDDSYFAPYVCCYALPLAGMLLFTVHWIQHGCTNTFCITFHQTYLISKTNFLSSTFFFINDHFRRDCTTGDVIFVVWSLMHQGQSCQDVYLFIMLNVCLLYIYCAVP